MSRLYTPTRKKLSDIFDEIRQNNPDFSLQKCLLNTLKKARQKSIKIECNRSTGIYSQVWEFWAKNVTTYKGGGLSKSGQYWAVQFGFKTAHRSGSLKGIRLAPGSTPDWEATSIRITKQAFYGLWDCLEAWKRSKGEPLSPNWHPYPKR